MSHTRRHVIKRVVLSIVGALVVAAVISSLVSIPYTALTPGTGIDISALISLPTNQAHHHSGGVFLTDVNEIPLHAIEYPYYRYFDSNATIEKNVSLTGPATSQAQYTTQGMIDMATARQAATAVVLARLGYKVRSVPSGVAVYLVEPGSPASKSLSVGDVITAIDQRPTYSIAELHAVLSSYSPGSTVAVTYHEISSKPSKVMRVTLGEDHLISSTEDVSCLPVGASTHEPAVKELGKIVACLGFGADQIYTTDGVPFHVVLNSDGIIGPSAGLSFALGLMDDLSSTSITGGRRIAATGTLSTTGSVGPVGGLAQKTVAVRATGATVFLVPAGENYRTAKAHAGRSLKVIAVTSFSQALAALVSLK